MADGIGQGVVAVLVPDRRARLFDGGQ